MADLKLGPLPNEETVKLTVELSKLFKEELDEYAAEYNRLYGRKPVKTAALIPHMLEAFLRADRAWCKRKKQKTQNGKRRVHHSRPDDGVAPDGGGH